MRWLWPHPFLIRVASVPAGHVYVRHLADPSGGDGVVRLDDPVPPGPDVPQRPVVASCDAVACVGAGPPQEFDVFHVQFGFDAQDADRRRLVDALRAVRKPLVYTVHDLRNPHHPDRQAHDAHLNVLIPQADGLITLTAGAAAEIAARWGRRPTVLPHPHVVELDRIPPGPVLRVRRS